MVIINRKYLSRIQHHNKKVSLPNTVPNMSIRVAPIQTQPSPPPLTCTICIEDITPGKNHVVTECGHDFHTSCYTQFVLSNNGKINCPNCRTEISNVTTVNSAVDHEAIKVEVEQAIIAEYDEIFTRISNNMEKRKKYLSECMSILHECNASGELKEKLDAVVNKLLILI